MCFQFSLIWIKSRSGQGWNKLRTISEYVDIMPGCRRIFGADLEKVGSRLGQNGSRQGHGLTIGHPMEGVHCIKDGVQ